MLDEEPVRFDFRAYLAGARRLEEEGRGLLGEREGKGKETGVLGEGDLAAARLLWEVGALEEGKGEGEEEM